MRGDVLVLNGGSSSLKFSLFHPAEPLELRVHGVIGGIGATGRFRACDEAGSLLWDGELSSSAKLDHAHALATVLEWLESLDPPHEIGAVGHRVVHGGTAYAEPVRIDAHVLARLEALTPLAPLHQPHNLAAVRALSTSRPQVPQVACFDTTFHQTQDPLVQRFAIPRDLTDSGIRRFGFHGLSFEYVASRLPEVAGDAGAGNVVVAHLGSGASLCAMRDGRSVDATTGFSALDGLPMGTRCGALDPGVVLYLAGERGMDTSEITDLLYRRSGLLGMSGISNDMRELIASDDRRAREAVEVFVYRVARELGAMAAALGGVDVLVFTGGIGEHAAPVREAVCGRARWLGVHLDREANAAGATRISRPDSAVAVYVVPTHEGTMIARHTLRTLGRAEAGAPLSEARDG